MARTDFTRLFPERMPLADQWIEEIFPDMQQPFSMAEIIHRLQQYYSPHISRSAVYRAQAALEKSEATRELVSPLNPQEKCKSYSGVAARRIARRISGKIGPERLVEPMQWPPKPKTTPKISR